MLYASLNGLGTCVRLLKQAGAGSMGSSYSSWYTIQRLSTWIDQLCCCWRNPAVNCQGLETYHSCLQ